MMILSQDENGPPVSGAAVDAYTERLKGVLGDGGAGAAAAAAAYGVRAGNGSLKPIPSPPPTQAPTNSSVPPATGLSFLGSILHSLHSTPMTSFIRVILLFNRTFCWDLVPYDFRWLFFIQNQPFCPLVVRARR